MKIILTESHVLLIRLRLVIFLLCSNLLANCLLRSLKKPYLLMGHQLDSMNYLMYNIKTAYLDVA